MPQPKIKPQPLPRPILFFDSGVGGLTVLRAARLLMPETPFLYAADNAGFPYGAWGEAALRARLLKLFAFYLEKYRPALSVLACNTASTLALDALRRAFPAGLFVGTVPAVKPAAAQSASKRIAVLATPGTVKRAYTRALIAEYAGETEVILVGSKNLAAIAEDYLHGRPVDMEKIRAEIAPCFVEKDGRRTDIIVLACTHYPFLTPLLRRAAPWPVDWLDPAEAIARRAQALMRQQAGAAKPPAETGQSRIMPKDYVIFTDQKAGADFISRRLFHAFGLEVKRGGSGL